ncbi:MAG: hypothetical protein QOE01_975 [Actinomycetota bacterium]|jgi:Flp pilus assembly protein TadG|nr:hypothetical protein [Actinomycetota bacterium]
MRGQDRGSVTAETAVLLPALVVVLVLALWAVESVVTELRCVDAARVAARAAARGEPDRLVRAAALAAAPPHAQIQLTRTPGDVPEVVVLVRATARLPGPLGDAGPGVPLDGRAVAALEEP